MCQEAQWYKPTLSLNIFNICPASCTGEATECDNTIHMYTGDTELRSNRKGAASLLMNVSEVEIQVKLRPE